MNNMKAWLEILGISTKLGLTSFGGPIAHLGYFHNEYVRRRKWLDEQSYADLVALCQFLPGPASSQVGIGIGLLRGGWIGALAAWIGFTLPSVLAMVLFAYLLQGTDMLNAGWVHGLKLVAVAIVAQAVWGMGQKLAPDRSRATVAILAAVIVLLWPTAVSQLVVVLAAAAAGLFLYRNTTAPAVANMQTSVSRKAGAACLLLFAGLLLLLPLLRGIFPSFGIALFDSFYRAGALVFGGGHVVLPLLEREAVPSGWLSGEQFLAGYGAAQAVPGPLFTFAAYIGAVAGGWQGALIATLAIFLPAFLLVAGALPFWALIRSMPRAQGALAGVNAAVVGILLAALYDPIWTSAVRGVLDFAVAAILFIMLVFWKLPPWVIVIAGVLGGTLIY
ncbi:chromate efflux transporter [Paenibacillus sp. P96]|uniref:Chromate efflux transporter n=1 Tax=Paenibacillus zeirhizosphaerae TaxID=2987519 RepID=A0ABT9FNQ6_9BACL|nr:chromate efflux transporter [Paenibacillus sp. P96]MDP4096324.1 chromate efflux transporter [Paenibacillus sp. P96]